MPTTRRSQPSRAAAAVAAALLAAACTTTAPTAAPTATTIPTESLPPSSSPGASQPAAAALFAGIRGQVEAIRGLQPEADVEPVTIDGTQLRSNLEAEFDRDNKPDDLRFSEDSLSLLGLLPKGTSIRAATLDFQGGQVAGYYSPDQKKLFVVNRSGTFGPADEVTYAHEFTHQLQDQNFHLLALLGNSANQSDSSLAKLALIEGDAVSVQTTWTVQNLTPEQMGQLLQSALDPEALAALRNAPAYIRETALFPYQDGLTFVTGLITSGGYAAVNAAFGHPPDSTEQVLHPEKYAKREAPDAVKLPGDLLRMLGAGWTEVGQDTLGEFILRLWLTQNGVAAATATSAAAGWGGDRLVLVRGPSGEQTLGLVTLWDTEADATEFEQAAEPLAERPGAIPAHLVSGGKEVALTFGPESKRLLFLLERDIPSRQ